MKRNHTFLLCVLVLLHLRSVTEGACSVKVTNLKAAQYTTSTTASISWDYLASGCSVSTWQVHYDSAAPVESPKTRGQSGTTPHVVSYLQLEAGYYYNMYVEAVTNTGEKIKSADVIYPPATKKPGSFPPNLSAVKVQYKTVSLAWNRCNPASLNGGFKAYSISYQDQVTRSVVDVEIPDKNILTKTISGFVPGRSYKILIRCANDLGYSSYSSPPVTVTIPSTAPCNVLFSNLNTVEYMTPNYASVTWSNNVTGCAVTKWIVHYDSVTPIKQTHSTDQLGTSTSITTRINVIPSFSYKVSVEAVTDSGKNFTSTVMNYNTPHDKTYVAPPNFTATSVRYDGVSLSWDKLGATSRNGDVKGYTISYYDVAAGTTNRKNIVGEENINTTISGLVPGNVYKLVIACVNDKGIGKNSPVITVTLPQTTTTTTTTTTPTTTTTTKSTTTAPSTAAPCSVTFSNLKASMYIRPAIATVKWDSTRKGCQVDEWMIHYDSTAPVRIYKNINQTHTVAGSIQHPVDVNPNFDYSIYVQAITDTGQMFTSPNFHYKAPKDKPYKSPSRFRTTSITANSVSFTWDKLDIFSKNGDVQGYRIAYRDTSSNTMKDASVSGENTLKTTVTGLQPNHTYQFVVACVNDIGIGPYSTPFLTITLPPSPTNSVSGTSGITTPTPGTPNSAIKTTSGTLATTPTYHVTSTGSTRKVTVAAVTANPVTPSSQGGTTSRGEITRSHNSDGEDSGNGVQIPLWVIVAIALGCLLLLAIAIALCCHFCCLGGVAVDDRDDDKVFRRKKIQNRHTRKNRAYSEVSLQSVDQRRPRYHRRNSVDSLDSLPPPVIIADKRKIIPLPKRRHSERKPAPKSVGTQMSGPISMMNDRQQPNRSLILTPSSIKPITIQPYQPHTIRSHLPDFIPEQSPYHDDLRTNSIPRRNSPMPPGGLSNIGPWTTIDSPLKATSFNHQSRSTSPGIPKLAFIDRVSSPNILSRGTSLRRDTCPEIPTRPALLSQSRGTSPIQEIEPGRSRNSISDYPNVPQYQDSPPVHKIEYNTIYKTHVNNTDNKFINNMFPNNKNIHSPNREPPISKPTRSLDEDNNVHNPRDSVFDEKDDSIPIINPWLEKPTMFRDTPKPDPIPRAVVYESKNDGFDQRSDWSVC